MIVRSFTGRSWTALGFAVLAAWVAACGGPGDLQLFRLQSVEAVHRDDHEVLRIHGEALPLGREASVTWSGTLHRAGLASRLVNARTRGRVIATDLIEVPMTEETQRAFYGGGTFHGTARVAFDARLGAAAITGSLDDVRVWIRVARAESLIDNLSRARRAKALSGFFGMGVSEFDVTGGGARVERVDEDGLASRAGIRAGDIVTEVDGAFVDDAKDLLPEPNADRIAFRIRRAGEVAPIDVLLSLGGFENQPPREDFFLGAFLVLFVVILSTFLAPSVFAPATIRARLESLILPKRISSTVAFVLLAVGFAAAMMLAVRRVPMASHVWPWLVVATVAHASAVFSSRQSLFDRARYRELFRVGLGLLALIAVAVLSGTESILAFGSLQSDRVWTWFAFKHPGMLLLAWIAFESLLVGDTDSVDSDLEPQRAAYARGARVVCRAIFVSLVVVMFFGGLHAPESFGAGVRWQWVVNVAAFATKVAALAAVSSFLGNATRVRTRVLLLTCLCAAAIFTGERFVPRSGVLDTLTANLTSFAAAALLVAWLARSVYQRKRGANVRQTSSAAAVELPSDAASSTA